jgi:uncharacterized protein
MATILSITVRIDNVRRAHPDEGHGVSYLRAASASSGRGADVELVPEDIEVSAAVDARFVVGDG